MENRGGMIDFSKFQGVYLKEKALKAGKGQVYKTARIAYINAVDLFNETTGEEVVEVVQHLIQTEETLNKVLQEIA